MAMASDTVLKIEGMEALFSKLGMVRAERFITLIKREPFDYTEWQKNLWADKTIEEIMAMEVKD